MRRPITITAAMLVYACAAGAPMLTAPAALQAQRVEGEVRDADDRPITRAEIALLDAERHAVATTVSDDRGAFELAADTAGSYYLRVRRIGYRTVGGGPYRLTRGSSLETLVVMHPSAVPAGTVQVAVNARVARLEAVGYYHRKAAGFGHFLERDDILEAVPMDLTDALRRLPGVRVFDAPPGQLGPGLLLSGGRGFCRPTVYLDGSMVAQGGGGRKNPVRPDLWVIPEDVEAVELYTGPASVPGQFQALASCGVMLIWTRHTPLPP